jgi:hypothetical protein
MGICLKVDINLVIGCKALSKQIVSVILGFFPITSLKGKALSNLLLEKHTKESLEQANMKEKAYSST